MEDFGSRLRNLKDEIGNKKIIKIVLIVITIIFVVILSFKIITMVLPKNDFENTDNVALIKAEKEIIKISPNDKGGLDINNLDIKVYDLVDKTKADGSKEVNLKNNIEEFDSDDFSNGREQLSDKIDEIMNENAIVETVSKNNVTINNKTHISSSDDLYKLGNSALIENINRSRDTKPGIKIQLLAMKSQESLIKYWNDLNNSYPTMFSDRTYYIEKSNIRGSGVIYRLQVGNFDTYRDADDFCANFIKASNKSKVDCITIKN